MGMIITLGAVAYYALTIYAGLPASGELIAASPVVKTVEFMCPGVTVGSSGIGAIIVAIIALAGAIGVAAVDLFRRVY